jgi:hypothetical protein
MTMNAIISKLKLQAEKAQTCPYINLGEENKEENGLLTELLY